MSNNSVEKTLKPCPFCGSRPSFSYSKYDKNKLYVQIACKACNVEMYLIDNKCEYSVSDGCMELIKKWNTRQGGLYDTKKSD